MQAFPLWALCYLKAVQAFRMISLTRPNWEEADGIECTSPYLCTNLVAALAGLHVHDLPHGGAADLLTEDAYRVQVTQARRKGWELLWGLGAGLPVRTLMIGCRMQSPGADWMEGQIYVFRGGLRLASTANTRKEKYGVWSSLPRWSSIDTK